jgi:hypothetical protein
VFFEKIKDYITTNKITIQEYLDKATRTNPKFLDQKEFSDLVKSTIQVSDEKVYALNDRILLISSLSLI